MNWADFLHADNNTMIFDKTDFLHCISDFKCWGFNAVVLVFYNLGKYLEQS